MKPFYRYVALSVVVLGLFSCTKNSEVNEEKETVIEPVAPVAEVLDAEAQGARLEETALAFIDKIESDDFSKAVELIENLKNTNWEKYGTEENAELFEDFISKVQTCKTSGGIDKWLYSLNEVRGKYVAKNGKITITDSDDFELYLEDDYHVKVTFSEKSSHVLFRTDTYYSSSADKPNDRYYYVDLPEEIKLAAEYKGKELVVVEMNSALNLQTSVIEFDPNEDSFDISLSVCICGYTVSLDKACYKSGKAQLAVSIYKGDSCLFTEKATVNGIKFVGNQLSNIDDAQLDVDVLGMVQVSVSSPDVIAMVDCVRDIEDIVSKADAAKVAETMNKNLTASVFYGTATPQATLAFEPVQDSKTGKWSVTPVIVIGDQKYEISEYNKILSDSKIKKIVSSFEDMCNDFVELAEKIY